MGVFNDNLLGYKLVFSTRQIKYLFKAPFDYSLSFKTHKTKAVC